MKSIFKKVTAALLPLFLLAVFAEAALVKRPLTLKNYAGQNYMEWAGSATFVTTTDTLMFIADTATANMYNIDPFNFLFQNKSATSGFNPWWTWPGGGIPEKLCVRTVMQAVSDAADISGAIQYATTKTGTLAQDAGALTLASTSATALDNRMTSVGTDPGKFSRVIFIITTPTDTVTASRATVWACDD